MNNIIKRVWNQNRMVSIEGLSGAAFQAEDGGHTFQISGIDDTGAAVSLSGTVAGVFRRPDNADIALTGSASGGVASVTLTDDCYAVPGRFGLTIFVTSGGQKTAVYACIGTVANTSGGAVAGETPQDVVDLINAISAAVATIPPSYTDLMAAIAPTYSSSALYAVGSYAWYDGDLYRCTTAITTAETWTASHWTITDIGGDIVHLRNVLSSKTGNLLPDYSADSWTSPTSVSITRNGYALIINGTKENAGAVTITDQFALGAGSYEFGVCDEDSLAGTGAYIQLFADGDVISQTQTHTPVTVPSATNATFRILLGAGSSFTNLSVKPMLFSGSLPSTYIPQVSAHDYVARNNVGEALSSISNLSNATAQDYSTSATYSVGDYVWHDGTLYRCTTAITTAEEWTAAHWTAAVLGDDVGDLKSALSVLTENTSFTSGVDYNVNLSVVTGKWFASADYTTIFYSVPDGVTNITVKANDSKTAVIALLKTNAHTNGAYPDYATGQTRIGIAAGETRTLDVPSDCHYVAVLKNASADNHYPASFIVKKYVETDGNIELLNSAVYGEPLDTFPLEFENGTYKRLTVGSTLERATSGTYDSFVKVVKTTVFNAPCDVVLTAKSGYRFNVFDAVNSVITGTSGRVTGSYVLQGGKQYGIILASTIDNTDISAVSPDDMIDIEYVSKIDVINNRIKSISVPLYPGGINRETGSSDMAYGSFWNLRTTPLIKANGGVDIFIDDEDIGAVNYFNIYEYSEETEGAIAYIQAIRNLAFNNGAYHYIPSSTAKYIRICLALTADNTKQFLPLIITGRKGIRVCKNPNITDGSKIALSYIVDGSTYTSGQLLLPPNYTINRKPCPLIVILHGTSSMRTWNQEIGTNSGTSTRYLLDYLTDEGFAVFDCYCFTSKYYSASQQNQDAPLPIFLTAYDSGVKYVCDNFNVDINNVCFFAMSAGGNLGQMVIHGCSAIKPKALAMLCPTTGFAHLLFREYFLYSAMRSIAVRYLDLENEEGAQTFISTTHGLDNAASTKFVTDHKDAFAGIICSAIDAHGATYEQQFDWMMTGTKTLPQWMEDLNLPGIPSAWKTSPATGIPSFVEHPELTSYSDVPVKYWQSFDDANVSGHANFTIYTWLKNGGTNVRWRTLPDGTGGHHAVDTDPNALKTSGTTRLGIIYTDIATTYVEMADFFYKNMVQ